MTDGMFVDAPEIYVVGRQTLDTGELVRFLQDEDTYWDIVSEDAVPDSLRLVETGGRICYMAFGDHAYTKTNTKYVRNLIEQDHASVLEHAVWTLIVTGVSRSLTHELIRHRVGMGVSQLSQRYVDAKDARFVIPPEYFNKPELITWWMEVMRGALATYEQVVEQLAAELAERNPGISKRDLRIRTRQAARSLLPNATETKIQLTINGRTLRHIIRMRGSLYAEAEIRRFAVALLRVMQHEAPTLFSDFTILGSDEGEYVYYTGRGS
ncbi:MAG: FAD-dependent thymidylate synthase [Ktedonobacterales bacterium]